MKNNKENTDRLIQRKIVNHEFDFSDHAWDQMEELLDTPPSSTRSYHFFIFRILAVMILLLVFLFFGGVFSSPNSDSTNPPIVAATTVAPESYTVPTTPTLPEKEAILTTEPTTSARTIKTPLATRATQRKSLAFENFKNIFPAATSSNPLTPLSTLPPANLSRDSSRFFHHLQAKLEAHQNHYASEKVYLHFDRTFFYPGDPIWFNAYLRDANTLKASSQSELVYIELLSPNGGVMKTLSLVAKDGRVRGDIQLAQDVAGGMYKIKAYTQWQKNLNQFFERDIQVQKVVLPTLRMELDFARKAYGASDVVNADLVLNTLDNATLNNHKFLARVSIAGKEIKALKGKTDEQGKANISFDLPKKLDSNEGLLNIVFQYKGQAESISRSIPIVLNKIDLQFLPEGGDLVNGLSSKVAFKAVNEFGKPADISGEIYNDKDERVGQFRSYHQGMGAFEFSPRANELYYARITQPQGIDQEYHLPTALPRGYNLQVIGSDQQHLKVAINSTETENLSLVLRSGGQIRFAQKMQNFAQKQEVWIPIKDLPIGIAEITLFDSKEIPRAERLAFLHADKRLDIQISTDKAEYLPREKVELTLKVKDERGIPMPGQFSLAVVDDNLLSYADDKQGGIMAYLLLESELAGSIEEPNFYFEPKDKHPDKNQLLALDYLMLTQGWRRFNWTDIQSQPLATLVHEKERAIASGQLIAPDGQPLANANLTVTGTAIKTRTDEQGKFELAHLPLENGAAQVSVQTANFQHAFQISKFDENQMIKLATGQASFFIREVKNGGKTYVKGVVKDAETGEGLIGANVFLKGTNLGASTDFDGNFNIPNVPPGNYTIETTYIGYQPITQDFLAKEGESLVADISVSSEGVLLESVQITSMKVEQKVRVQAMSVQKLAARDADIAAPPPPVDQIAMLDDEVAEEKEEVIIRGSRADATDFFIDGVRVKENGKKRKNQKQAGLGKEQNKNLSISSNGRAKVGKAAYAVNFQSGFYKSRDFYAPQYKVENKSEVRTDFRSTVFWEPSITLDRKGEAQVEFYTSDALTTFQVKIEGLTTDGGIGQQEHRFFSQKPVSLRTKLPTVLLTGDELKIPVTLENNTTYKISGKLEVSAPAGFTLKAKPKMSQKLSPGETKTVYLEYQAEIDAQSGNFKVNFNSKGYQDGMQTKLVVQSRGYPVAEVFSGSALTQNFEVKLNDPIADSEDIRFSVYPSVLGDLVTGLDRMLRQPGGCFEQTSSSNYPNLLVLDYLRSTNEINSKVEKTAMNYLDKGYKRLLTFEVDGGGFDWFGNPPAHEALTAYGLMEFKDMQEVYSVDPALIERTAKWLLSRRDGKGGWKNAKRALHSWQAQNPTANAYIVWALTEAGFGQEIKAEIDKTYTDALKSEDPYLLALMANTLILRKDKRGTELMEELLKWQQEDGSWMGATTSMTHSTGLSLQVETTALAVLAILKSQKGRAQLNKAITFISGSKNQYGFGSTQSTVLAMKALVEYAKYNRAEQEAGTIVLRVNGKKVLQKKYAKGQKDPMIFDDLAKHFKTGTNQVTVEYAKTKTALPFDLSVKYNTRQPNDSPECKLTLSTTLDATSISQGETVRLTTTLGNQTKEALQNPIAIVGLPAGLSPQAWQLKELQEKGVYDFYEIKEGYVVFYYRGIAPEDTKTIRLDLKADLPGSFEAPASVAYLYYSNEYQNWSKPARLEILP